MLTLKKPVGPLLVVIAALVAVAPQLIRGNSCGHDFNVHLVSWLDCLSAWRHGILYPHWTPSPNYGAGEPRFVFYPPLTWMMGAVLGMVFPWALAPIALTFLILVGTGLATRALALEACEDGVATLAGCAAIFSGFTLFNAYERSAFPEFMGGVWMPLLLLYALRERTPGASMMARALDGSTVPLSIVLGAAWLSNAPLGVMANYLLAAVAIMAAVLRKSWAPLVRASLGSAVGLSVSAFYWLPAKIEQQWVAIQQTTKEPGFGIESNWAFWRNADPQLALHDAVLRQASWIAVTMIAVAAAGAVVSWRRGTLTAEKTTELRSWWIPLALIPLIVLVLIFPISRLLWNLPEWRFLQFPWRWMEAVGAPMAIFFAAAVWPRALRAKKIMAAICAVAFAGATVYAGMKFFQVCWVEDSVQSTVATFHAGSGFLGLDEYAPPEANLALVATSLPDACLISDPKVALGKPDSDGENPIWKAPDQSCKETFQWAGVNPEHRQMHANAPQAGWVILRLLSFPAWKLKVNDAVVDSLPRRADGLIAVPVAQGANELTVDWTTTPDVAASRWVSLLGFLGMLCVYIAERERSRAQVS